MKYGRCNICHKCATQLITVFAFLLVLLGSGCKSINPELHEEYVRPGLNQNWHTVFDTYRKSIPKAMNDSKIPGLSIALVDREGIIWTAGFGYTDYDCRTPVTPETIFSLQSITKALTATLALCAMQDGWVDLDHPISKYIPDFKLNSRFEVNPQNRITLRHLLTHRSGLIHEAPVGNNFDPECPSFEAHIKSISDTWLKHKVNSQHAYSNLGMDLVAYILETQAGKPYEDYLEERLFDPLNMPNSSANMAFIQNYPNRAIGHIPYHRDLHVHVPMIGAGGVYSSARDFSKYIQFNLNRGKVNNHTILREDLFSEMHKGEYGTQGGKSGIQGLGIIHISDGIHKLDDVDCELSGPFWGGGFGFHTYSAWTYEYGIGVLVFTNKVAHNQNEEIAVNILHESIKRKLVKKNETSHSHIWQIVTYDVDKQGSQKKRTPDQFTYYQPHWKKYIGSYKHVYNWKPTWLGRIGKIVGLWGVSVNVYEKNGYLEINGERLDEHIPGVFFTNENDCLDFSGSTPLWKGVRIKKR